MNRVLNVVFGMANGGTEAFILNTFNNIDRSRFLFDYLYFTKKNCPQDEYLKKLGANIYRVTEPNLVNKLKFIYQIYRIIKLNKIKIVHAHVNEMNGIVCLGAFLGGAKVRISHMHFPYDYNNLNLFKKVYRRFQVRLIEIFSINIFYCSLPTYESYKFKKLMSKKSLLVKNTINIKKYSTVPDESNKYYNDFSIPYNHKIIVNITRFDESKNQKFIVEIFETMLNFDKNLILLLGGDGTKKNEIIEFVNEKNLNESVRFIGVRDDVHKILKITDLYIFPSKEEGFGIVVLEAQASGTNIICSTAVPIETDLKLGLVHYLDLNLDKNTWAEFGLSLLTKKKINFTEEIINNAFVKLGFDAKAQTEIIEKIYLNEK
jgi:glycosyltransferase EpsF